MDDFFTQECNIVRKHFHLESVLRVQEKNDIHIVRGEDYGYHCYIGGKCYSTALTPMLALMDGTNKFLESR